VHVDLLAGSFGDGSVAVQ